ncbi:MAG: hypothetical protein IT585_05630 [candidate division Zixibacteria bacterium]|nr:hypothetical protein [candidate division Zixibacteria bacterium]
MMNRHHRAMLCLRLALLVMLVCSTGSTAFTLDSAYVGQLRRGIAFTMTEQFDSARLVFQHLVDREANDFAARLYLAGVDHAEMLDREEYDGKEKFESDAEHAIDLAEDALKRGHDSAWAYLTIGNAHAYIASLEAKAGGWWSAMRRGLKAKGAYLEALKTNPALYDAYLGLGTYHYWKSAKTEFINWFPLVGDRKDDGVRELELAVDSSLFSGDLALNSLVWIQLHRKQPGRALACAERLHARYPNSRLVTWGLAFSSYAAGRYHEALDYFGAIITSLESDSTQNYFNLIECRYHRAEIFGQTLQSDAERADLTALLAYPVNDDVKQRQADKLKASRKRLDQLAKAAKP